MIEADRSLGGTETTGALLERDDEMLALAELGRRAGTEGGVVVLIAGEAGIGKTALLDTACQQAMQAGARVLHARCAELEHEFPYGVVRQLLTPLLLTLDPSSRDALFDGAAALARPILLGAAQPAQGPDPDFGTLHGLYWLLATLAQREPLLMAIDDLQWSDGPSLRLLQFLRRRQGLPTLIVGAVRPDDPGPAAATVADLLDDPSVTVLRPRPLSIEAVDRLLRVRVSGSDEQLAAACLQATGGVPLYLVSVLEDLAEAEAATVQALDERASRQVSRSVWRRLAACGPEATALAEAVAVLGDGADLPRAAALAGLPESAARSAQEALVACAVLDRERSLAFVHPVVRTAVYLKLSDSERGAWHARAAAELAGAAAAADAVAAQLMRATPGVAEGALEILYQAALRALEQGAPEVAVSYLARALTEPSPADERVKILMTLAHAESRAGMATALEHLAEAAELATQPVIRQAAIVALARGLGTAGRSIESIDLLDREISALGDREPQSAARLQLELLSVSDLDLAARPYALERIGRADWRLQDSDGPLRDLHEATARVMSGDRREEAIALVERALAGDELLEHALAGSPHFSFAAFALIHAGAFDLAQSQLDRARGAAQVHGSAVGFALSTALRAFLGSRRGSLVEAEADGRAAVAVAELNGWPPMAQAAFAALAEVLLERGDPDAVFEAAAVAGIDLEALDGSTQGTVLLELRGRVRLAQSRPEESVADLLEAGARYTRWGVLNPAAFAWRSNAARALQQLGETERANELVTDELRLARRWDAPRTVGVALNAVAALQERDDQIATLREAVEVLRGSGARTVLARSLAELGAALRRSNRRSDARSPLREALGLAREAGADGLADRAYTELWATGARPRFPRRLGLDALTPSERRVADMAASGLSNAQIAQALFVTVKTVEMHLSGAYRKLDLGSRSELGVALGTELDPSGGMLTADQ